MTFSPLDPLSGITCATPIPREHGITNLHSAAATRRRYIPSGTTTYIPSRKPTRQTPSSLGQAGADTIVIGIEETRRQPQLSSQTTTSAFDSQPCCFTKQPYHPSRPETERPFLTPVWPRLGHSSLFTCRGGQKRKPPRVTPRPTSLFPLTSRRARRTRLRVHSWGQPHTFPAVPRMVEMTPCHRHQ